MIVERVAPGGQSDSGTGGAVAECSANLLRVDFAILQHICRQPWIAESHPANAHHADIARSHLVLGGVREQFLQIAVSAAHYHQVRVSLRKSRRRVEVIGNLGERFARREIAVERRVIGRPGHVGVVVRTSDRDTHECDPKLGTQIEELVGLSERISVFIGAKDERRLVERLWIADSFGVFEIRPGVYGAQPNGDREVRAL